MKKVLFVAAIAVVALSSCRKDYECSIEILGIETTTTCEKCNKADVEELEDAGWSCE